ncbi:MAG: hypothetical protein V3576_04395 [Candidatus Cloacimonadota bacterium]
MSKYCLAILVISLLLVGCSSTRMPLQPQAKFNADNALKLAQDYELQRRYANAIDTYTFAFELYKSFASMEGQMHCLSGLARIANDQAAFADAEDYRFQMEEIVRDIDPGLAPILLLYDLHLALGAGEYERISTMAVVDSKLDKAMQMQILSYKIQADSFLGRADETQVRSLQRLAAKHLKKPLRKRQINPQILSQACYALAYYHYTAENLSKAARYAELSNRIDYSYGNFGSYAYGLWLQGRIQAAQSDEPSARASYLKARQIFQNYANLPMLDRVEEDLNKLEEN